MESVFKNSNSIARIICVFIIFYISVDLPKLYFLIFIFFIIFFIFEKINFKIFSIYLIPLFLILFYLEPQLFQGNLNNLSTYYNIIWGITALLISLIVYSCLEKEIIKSENIIFFIFLGSIASLIIIFLLHLFIFDFPITRNGFIHPLSKINSTYIFFSLDDLKYINPINIRSFYEIIELTFLSSLLLVGYNKKSNYFVLISILLFILGCSFGSRLFVIYCFFINLIVIFFANNKKKYLLILFLNSFIFFSNVTIYSFIPTDTYINLFKKEDTNYKKIKSFNSIFGEKYVSPIVLSTKYFKEQNFFKMAKKHKIYLEDNYFVYNPRKNFSYLIKFSEERKKYLRDNNLSYEINEYTNRFTENIDSFRTSYYRFTNKKQIESINNRPRVILTGVSNIGSLIFSSKKIDFDTLNENTSETLKDRFDTLNENTSETLKYIFPAKVIIYHNLFLDTIFQGAFFASIILVAVYFKIIFSYYIFFKKKLNHVPFILMLYSGYDQLLQTSLLTGKKSIFLFCISFVLIVHTVKLSYFEKNLNKN